MSGNNAQVLPQDEEESSRDKKNNSKDSNSWRNSKYLDPEYKGEKLSDELVDGPVPNRGCTDIICCLIFTAFMFAWFAIGIYGFSTGDPMKLTYAYDYDGNQCGYPGDNAENYPFIYFPFPILGYTDYTVCVKDCPESSSSTVDCYTNSVYTDCSFRFFEVFDTSSVYGDITGIYSSEDYLGRLCFPSSDNAEDWLQDAYDTVNDTINLDTLSKWMGDVWTTRWACLVVAGVAIVTALVYLFFLRLFIGVIVWLSILLTFSILLIIAIFLHWSSENQYQDDADSDTPQTLYIMAIIFYCLAGFFLLYILCMCNRIRLGIAIMKTGTLFITNVWTSLLVPPVIFLLAILLFLYWVVASVYVYSSGNITQEDKDPFAEVENTTEVRFAFYVEVWGILWVASYIIALGQFILAGSVCIWYFAYGSDSGPQRPVSRAVWWSFRYHLGSIAFGSLVLAIVWTIKYILVYIKTKMTSMGNDPPNPAMRFLIKALMCFVYCLEKFIKFLNKNAYIQICLQSVSFCTAAREAFFIILRNAGRFITLGAIGGIFNLLGKWLIALFTAYAGYLIITRGSWYENELSSPVFPTIVFFFVGYVIASLFMGVYAMACDTILQCFLADEELCKNKNRPPAHSPPALQSFLEKEREKNQHDGCC